MFFEETKIRGAYLISLDKKTDSRGGFARVFCEDEFRDFDLTSEFVQANMSTNQRKGTLRGMHYQSANAAEAKLVRCTQGAIFDVIVDMRLSSSTYLHWFGSVLSSENERALYVPEGCAHGYLTLTNAATVFYFVSHRYSPENEKGLRYDDPAIGIEWPEAVAEISDKDASWDYLEIAEI